ncbi:MAG: chemotaxis protein CheW [Myxococcaceae bacterium]
MDLENTEPLAVLRVGDWRFALPLRHVERVFSAALPIAVPSVGPAPAMAVRIEDDLVPVTFAATLLGAADILLKPEHKMVLLASGKRRVILWVDAVEEIVPYQPIEGKIELPADRSGWVAGYTGGERTLAILDPAAMGARA